jgi:hypothetical protein
MLPWILDSIEIPGVERTGLTLLLPTPARVSRFEIDDGSLILEMAGDDE